MTQIDTSPEAMPERIWAWRFMPEKCSEEMQGGWTEYPDKREAEYVPAAERDALAARLAEVEAERDAARAALKEAVGLLGQFADAADEADDYGQDDENQAPVDCGQCRSARAFLAKIKENSHE